MNVTPFTRNNTEKSDTIFQTPVLLTIFNNPESTKAVFESIRDIRPAKLFVSADGPRSNKSGESKLCEEARKITEIIDWPCEVHRKYEKVNLGCRVAMSEAITWFFNCVEEGIILEDDCVPNESFFIFCQTLLEKYRTIDTVKMISGNNFQFGKKYDNNSYYFSNFPSIWGWATWRRA